MRLEMNKMNRAPRGFSLLELLIALIILAVLAAILIPIVSGRTRQARYTAAETEMENIGEAEARVAIDTGYYTRLFMLNYAKGGSTLGPFDRQFNYPYQVRDITGGGYFQNIPEVFIEIESGDVTDAGNLLDRIQSNETLYNWNGPYITWHRDSNLYGGDVSTDPTPDGIPDDPWGTNYLLFTEAGLVVEPTGTVEGGTALVPPGGVPGAVPATNLDRFGRLTLVSLGPDGLFDTSDDLVRTIGQ